MSLLRVLTSYQRKSVRPFLSAGLTCSNLSEGHKKDMEKGDHLERTSSNTRDDGTYKFRVKTLLSLSPTVREVVLETEENPPRVNFKAGQWADVFIPGVNTVGGFSMTSSPQELSTLRQIRFAIKYSTHPPALWMHESCKVGDELEIRIGGDFYLNMEKITPTTKILLVAGGVGVNPLSSIINHIEDGKREGIIPKNLRFCLLYSAKSEDELFFKDTFDQFTESDPHFRVQYFVTGKDKSKSAQQIKYNRMLKPDLESAAGWLTTSDTNASDNIQAFICGPPSMINSISKYLTEMKLVKINFEKWW